MSRLPTKRENIRSSLITVLLLCAKNELHFAYLKSDPLRRIPSDFLFLWQNEYPPEGDILEHSFSKEERLALGHVQAAFERVCRTLPQKNGVIELEDEAFKTFQKETKKALLVFPMKAVSLCYERAEKRYGV